MKPSQLLGMAAYLVIRNWGGSSLKLETVQEWIKENGNRDDYGRGYAGNRLPDSRDRSYAEVRKESVGGGVQVVANIFLDARQGAAVSKTWKVKKLDSKLEKFFGNNLRVRIDV